MEASPTKLIEQLTRYFSGSRLYAVYEAGFSGYDALHRVLQGAGVNNIVVNPGSVETASRDNDVVKQICTTQLSNFPH